MRGSEKKRIRNSAPKIQNVIQPIVTCHVSFACSINISSFALLQQCKIRTNQDTLIHLCAKILKKKLKIYYVWIIGMSRIYLYLIENQDPSKSERAVSFRGHSSITSSRRWVGGVKKWKFLMSYSTVNHQRVGWVGLKKSKT